jgi:UDP-N-acetylmuramoyl-tripeptide--D-alanyl-D-alanine ligase
MDIQSLYTIFRQYPNVITDSRKVVKDSLFFALKGANFNGNLFARQALDNGAAYAVVDEPGDDKDDRIILVDDVLLTLQNLSSYHRRILGIPILAVTGSNGKTTTKELTAAVLSKKFNLRYTQGNLNNHIGVPLTLLSLDESTELAVVEMGANHPGEIDFLCRIAEPDFGLITNVGKAHLEGFGSFEMVIQTKTEMYRYLAEKNGHIFINAGNKYLMEAAINFQAKITYGTEEGVYLRGETLNSGPFLSVRAWFPLGILYINTKLIGNYNTENVLAAAAIGKYFGVDPLLIKEGLETYAPSNNRSQMIKTQSNQIIMDAYNANPSSMQASIHNFVSIDHPSKTLIIGDMLELGEYSPNEHQKIIDLVSSSPICRAFVVGELFNQCNLPEKCSGFKQVTDLAQYLTANPIIDSLILIKGSRGIGLERVLDVII